ncbi:MAG: hypothetical protein KF830_15870 [Planctomycetes bacterium]|nr:hypothetical protein [Planctomycetota bacterium]
MDPRSNRSHSILALVALLATACGGGSSVSNASPRIDDVPLQVTTGGSFSLDLGDFVRDREGASLTYAVTAGGGSFADSVYSHTFDSMGEYEVQFTVGDGAKTTPGSFRVRVTQADFAVVLEDQSGLLLLDTGTLGFVRVTGAAATPSFAAGLGDGRLVYHVAAAAGQQLWVFDPMARQATRLGADQPAPAQYVARTSDHRVLYTTGSGANRRLAVFNPRTGLARQIAEGVLDSLTVVVNADDLVFYEVGVDGQADVRCYDPEADASTEVGAAPTDEQIQGLLPNGGIVFSRLGAGGEADLYYFRFGTGLVEVGADVAAIGSRNKIYNGAGSASQVVFTAQSGAVSEVFAWNPANGQTTAISAEFGDGEYDLVASIGSGNEVVLQRVVSAAEVDAFFYDLDSGLGGVVRDDSDVSAVVAVSGDGTTTWAFVLASGSNSTLRAISLVATPATQSWTAGGPVSTTIDRLPNGDVVAARADGTALAVFDVSVGSWAPAITGTDLAFAGVGVDGGDFVYSATVGAQTDLAMWDASAIASVVVSDVAGDDVYQARAADGAILFTRVGSGGNADLFRWDGATTRLTDVDAAGLAHDHAVLGQYFGAR